MIRDLIQALKDRQTEEGLTQQGMADKLRINQSTLSRLYAGKRDLGIDTLEQILQVYPELSGFFLAQHIHPGKSISVQAMPTATSPHPHPDAP